MLNKAFSPSRLSLTTPPRRRFHFGYTFNICFVIMKYYEFNLSIYFVRIADPQSNLPRFLLSVSHIISKLPF
ncbi:hypothetical protein CW304_16825 [Bacillus sp. UFRGS-B20]|nr:hypothetical protein CW304_16825 [Bacillus sp. UFRGS-B20]